MLFSAARMENKVDIMLQPIPILNPNTKRNPTWWLYMIGQMDRTG